MLSSQAEARELAETQDAGGPSKVGEEGEVTVRELIASLSEIENKDRQVVMDSLHHGSSGPHFVLWPGRDYDPVENVGLLPDGKVLVD